MIQTIVFPINLNIFIVRTKYYTKLFLLHKDLTIINYLNSKLVRIHPNFCTISFLNLQTNKRFCNNINKFFFIWNKFFTIKIRVNGKGFKLKINGNQLHLMWNYANFMLYQYKKLKFYKLEKHKYIFFFSTNLTKSNLYKLLNLRPINPYTKRGVKILNSKFFTKRGKVTSI